MRIAQVAPLYDSVPPKYYGGTERVVPYFIEQQECYQALIVESHEVSEAA